MLNRDIFPPKEEKKDVRNHYFRDNTTFFVVKSVSENNI